MQFTESRLNAAIETARAKAAGNRALLNAIEKAAVGLRGAWIVTELHDGLLITSDSGETYKANGTCGCAAYANGMVCKHRVAYRIVSIYQTLETAPAVSARASMIADIKAAWSRRFPGESLADELLLRFRVNTLDYLAEDMLRGVLAACA
jgi:hypothetical protein